ncbi:dicarboxylate/amino acid:cation symporter [Gemmata sp. JC673]|uniref:Dicarboxylate/amino acid:cation symporter n=1 Tax=Gemmata algarum TaxID=2975278 RepID=A0ABU5EZF7_9BACT|nr:dicarboxylate/amino acid:cation symporter [Gemmata algarum]MDY3560692.1 dicarboxylate/amino acid:cation symporter [Gemmata algarum]
MAAAHTVPHTRILFGLIGGAALGCLANALVSKGVVPAGPVDWAVKYLARPVGAVFLNLLFLPILPLVFASLVLGVTRLGGTNNVGRIGAKTVLYFLITTALAAAIGLTLVNLIEPGAAARDLRDGLMAEYGKEAEEKLATAKKKEFGVQTFVNIVPANPLVAFVEKDMLAIVFTGLLVGFALTRIDPARAALLVAVLEGVNQVTEVIVRWAMALAPYAVFALLFSTTAKLGYTLLFSLGAFVLTVLGGLALHQFVVLPLLVKFLGGMAPGEFFAKARGTMLTAFSTSSSSATLPTAIRCAEEDLNVPREVSNFVLPLSASMNHNGTALFESVTVLFLAQAFGVQLNLEQQLVALVLCILTASGMAGVPGGSLPLIGLILVQFNVPAGGIALVIGVDRLLDMCRTTVNVTADLTTAVFVARSERRYTPAGEAKS